MLCTLIGCGGKVPINGPSPLDFAGVPLPNGAVGEPYKEVIVVTGGLQPYTYTVTGSLPPGLSMDSSGVVSGTPTMMGTSSFVVTVADSQTPIQARNFQSFSITINPQLTLPVATLSNATIGVAYSGTITASGGVMPYTYALAPGSAALPAGLTLNADGTITGTPTGPVGPFSFMAQVTDSDPVQAAVATQTFSLTVVGILGGSYAFSFNGYNNLGQAFYMAGSFVGDGGGNITSGVLDRNGNDSTGVMTAVPITPGKGASGLCPVPSGASGSTYCVGSNNLGTITIASALGTYQFQVALAVNNDSTLILADPNHLNLWGSGVLRQQNLAGLSLAQLKASFAFGFFGVDAGGHRLAGAGTFTSDASGNLTAGLEDTNDNGTVKSQVPFTGKFLTLDPTTGRGTERLNMGSETVDYAFYVVSSISISQGGATGGGSIELTEIQTDAVSNGVTLASVLSQRGAGVAGGVTFTNASLTGVSVMELNAVSSVNGNPAATLGLATFDGSGNITSFTTDENNGGTACSGGGTICQNSYTGTYKVDPNGRVTVTGIGSPTPVWYLVATDQGFVVGTDASITAGSFEPQTGSPFFTISIVGNYYGGTITPVSPAVTNEADSTVTTPPPPPGSGNGSLTVTYDSSGPNGVMANQMLTATYLVDSTGRAVLQDASGNTVAILYIVSSVSGATNGGRKNVLINPGNNPRLTVAVH